MAPFSGVRNVVISMSLRSGHRIDRRVLRPLLGATLAPEDGVDDLANERHASAPRRDASAPRRTSSRQMSGPPDRPPTADPLDALEPVPFRRARRPSDPAGPARCPHVIVSEERKAG